MIDKRFRANEIVTNKISQIKSILKEKYGSEYNDIIDERIDKMYFLPYFNTEQMGFVFTRIVTAKTDEYIKEFFKEINIEATEDNINNYFNSYPSLKYSNDFALQTIYTQYDKPLKDYQVKNLLDKIEKISDEKVEYQSDRYYQIINNLLSYKKAYDKIFEKYANLQEEYKDIIALCEEEEKIKKDTNAKYEKVFFEYIKKYMPPEDLEKLKNPYVFKSELSCNGELIGYNYQTKTMLDAFTKESFEILNQESSYARTSIIEDQIRFFNKHGIKVTKDTFEEFYNSPQYKESLPDLNMVEEIVNYRKELHKKELMDVIKKSQSWKYIEQVVPALNLKGSIDELAELIMYEQTCVSTDKNINDERMSLLMFDLGHVEEYVDNGLIHEIEHIITTPLGVQKEGEPGYSGFDVIYEGKERNYEQINEIINEMEAQETTKMLHDRGEYILNDPSNAKIVGGTNYERNRVLVEEFFTEFKDVIRKARINADLSIIYDEVGQDNFEELVNLVNSFTYEFSSSYYQLLEQVRRKESTELTRKYVNYIYKSHDIVNQMKQFKLEKTAGLTA